MLGHGNFLHNIQPLIGGKKIVGNFFLKIFFVNFATWFGTAKKIFFEPKQIIFLSEVLIIE